jgi:hypothetical protein
MPERATVLSQSEKSAEAIVGSSFAVHEGPNEGECPASVDVGGIASDARASGAVQRRAT